MLVLNYGAALVSLYCFKVGTVTSKHIRGVQNCLLHSLYVSCPKISLTTSTTLLWNFNCLYTSVMVLLLMFC